MTTHSVLVGARTRGHQLSSFISAGSTNWGKNSLILRVPEHLAITSDATELKCFRDGGFEGNSVVLVLEDVDGVTDECVDELVQSLVAWTVAHPDEDLTVYWSLIGLSPARVLELTEKLMPLVVLG